jgi:murein L,D-transpeptidase YcbB/YkuD
MSRFIGVVFASCALGVGMASAAATPPADLAEALRLEIESMQVSGRLDRSDVAVASAQLLARLYEQRRFEPAWHRPQQAVELLELIAASERDGLDPDDYHVAGVRHGVKALASADPLPPEERAELDILLTDSLARLAYHERFGKVDPYTLDPQWNFRRELAGADPVTALQTAIDSPSLRQHLEMTIPRGWFYRAMRDALSRYKEIAANGGWEIVPEGPTLRPGDADSRTRVIARRLAVTGDLGDSAMSLVDDRYGEELEQAVRRFQARHALDVDGIVGPGTLRAMNVSAAQRVRQLEVNLERARWVLDDISEYFILVNIAGFRVYVIRDREIVWESRVQVGRTYRRSPVFRDAMKYLVFNPTWTVPYSIATRDLLPQIKQDPGFFETRGFDLRNRNGEAVDPSSVNWGGVAPGRFPYTLVQRPGPANAMGLVKFMFPNQYAVYLHDTPSRYLFDRADRTFSSGCIRVENPFELAEILLGKDGWTQERFRQVLDTGKEQTVFLSEPVPVLLLYWTAQVSPDGTVSFFRDVYERDAAILKALDAPFALGLPVSASRQARAPGS